MVRSGSMNDSELSEAAKWLYGEPTIIEEE